jgi:hypothetical protein
MEVMNEVKKEGRKGEEGRRERKGREWKEGRKEERAENERERERHSLQFSPMNFFFSYLT